MAHKGSWPSTMPHIDYCHRYISWLRYTLAICVTVEVIQPIVTLWLCDREQKSLIPYCRSIYIYFTTIYLVWTKFRLSYVHSPFSTFVKW